MTHFRWIQGLKLYMHLSPGLFVFIWQNVQQQQTVLLLRWKDLHSGDKLCLWDRSAIHSFLLTVFYADCIHLSGVDCIHTASRLLQGWNGSQRRPCFDLCRCNDEPTVLHIYGLLALVKTRVWFNQTKRRQVWLHPKSVGLHPPWTVQWQTVFTMFHLFIHQLNRSLGTINTVDCTAISAFHHDCYSGGSDRCDIHVSWHNMYSLNRGEKKETVHFPEKFNMQSSTEHSEHLSLRFIDIQ